MGDCEESHENKEKPSEDTGSQDNTKGRVSESVQKDTQNNATDVKPTVSSVLSLRLQPCDGPTSSISLTPTKTGTVINLPTVFKSSPEQASGSGTESKVAYFRLFNSSQLAGVSKPNVIRPEQFVTSVLSGNKARQPSQMNEQPVKRKRGRPRLNQPHELRIAPIPNRPLTTNPSVLKTSQLVAGAASAEKNPKKAADLEDTVPARFTIADLPPDQRPSFAFRRDLRKQLMMKSLDQRISWALGKKVKVNLVAPPDEEIDEMPQMKTRSGRLIKPLYKLNEDGQSLAAIDPESAKPAPGPSKKMKLIVNSPLPPPPRKRGRPRKTRPVEDIPTPPPLRIPRIASPPPRSPSPPQPTPLSKLKLKTLITPPSPPTPSEATPESPTDTNASVAAVEDSLLSEDYILRNLQYWENKRKELEKRKEARRINRGPAKSVNIVLQSSSVHDDEESRSSIMSMSEYREQPRRLDDQVRRYRPILPRSFDLQKLKDMSQEERLQEFRKRSENEKKMRLIRGVDFVPVHSTPMDEKADKAEEEEEDEDKKISNRLEEILKEIVEDVPDDDTLDGDLPVPQERNVDIDADSPPTPAADSETSKKKKKKLRPVSHGTLTDHSITRFDDPDAVMREVLPRKRRLEVDADDDEPPLITTKPKKDKLVRPADVAGSDNPQTSAQWIAAREEKVKKRQAKRPPNWPFGPAAPEEKRIFRPPSKPSTKIAPPVERRLIYSLMQNAVQLTMGKQMAEAGTAGAIGTAGVAAGAAGGSMDENKQEENDPLSYIVLESESEIESSEEEGEDGQKKQKPPKKFSCAAVTIKLAATSKSSLVFAPPTDIHDETTKINYDEGVDSGVEENGVLWKFPTQFFNGAKYQEIAPLVEQEEETPEPRRRQHRAPTATIQWNVPDFGAIPLDNRCPHCTRHFTDPHRLWRHLISHSDKKPFVCSLCGKGHRLPEYLSYHHRLHHSDGEELLPCPHCPKRALFYSQLEAHLLNKHNAARPFPCGQCEITFALEASLEDHVRSAHEPQSTMCDLCGISLPDEVSRTLHRRQHTEERPFSCPDCPGKAFKSKRLLGHHRMVEHDMERQHECHKCLKTFFFLKDMQRHMATAHSHPEPFQCSLCNQQFLRRQQLTRHMEKSHRGASNRPFRCQMCGSCFPTERALERHQHHVHGDKEPEPPPTETTSELNAGKRKMFSCRYCDLLFTARSAVTQHIESVHIDTLALRCRHCRQPCLNHADLERHILEHKDRRETLQTRRPNRRLCVACGEMMASRADLERHLKEEHDELVQFMCPICSEFFLTNQLYYEHTCRQEEEGMRRETRAESYSSEEEPAAGQQDANNMEPQVESGEGYQEWPRRHQWPEYSREEPGQYYSGW